MNRARLAMAFGAVLIIAGALAYVGCTRVDSPSPTAPSEKAGRGSAVATTTSFGKCIAGNLRTDYDGDCEPCEDGTTTTSAIQIAFGHPQSCESFKHGVIAFDTSSLDDNATITSAKLKFNVHTVTTNNIYQARLRMFVGGTSPCPTSLDAKYWADCAGAVDLGTIDINGTGNYEFTIPSPNSVIEKTLTTVFMIEDASIESVGASLWDTAWELRSVAAGSAWAPTLEVVN